MEITEDSLLAGKIRFLQPKDGYRAAIDPVLLAAALPVRPGDLALDAGAGAGAASLCLGFREPECRIVGIEVNPDMAALGAENARANRMEDRLGIVAADLARPPADLKALRFDAVMTNPPFDPAGGGTPSPKPGKSLAHMEGGIGLADWVALCARRLKPKGAFAMIHRAGRMDEAMAAMRAAGLGGLVLIPLWPKAGAEARRAIFLAVKGSKSPARLTGGLVLHEGDGRFTPAARRLLELGGALAPGEKAPKAALDPDPAGL